ncbi:MAG: hypothetical protein ABFD81_08855 [Syntrophaceae bacterium]
MLALVFAGVGCSQRHDEERRDLNFLTMNQDQVLSSAQYPDLNSVLGAMTGQDLLAILDTCLLALNKNHNLGYTSSDDYRAMLRIITRLRDTMAEEMSSETLDTTLVADMAALLAIMAGEDSAYPGARIGSTLDQLIQRLGPDCLRDQVKAMLTYIMLTDSRTLQNAVSGLNLSDITGHQAAFTDLMSLLNGLVDPRPEGRYAGLYEGLIDYGGAEGIVDQIGDITGSDITLGDLKPVLDDLKAIDFSSSGLLSAETESQLDQAITALIMIIEGRASSLDQADIENMAGLLSKLLNWWNTTDSGINQDVLRDSVTEVIDLLATDANTRQELAEVLYSLARLLNSSDLPEILTELDTVLDEEGLSSDQTLQTLLTNVLTRMPAASDTNRLLPEDLFGTVTVSDRGILTLIAQDYSRYGGVDEGLSDYLIQRDLLGTLRTSSGRESAIVALLKAMQNADVNASMSVKASVLLINLNITMTALNIVHPQYSQSGSWHDCAKDSTTNISEFLVGEIVRAIKYRYGVTGADITKGGAPASADYNANGIVDPNEAMYWLLWQKHYHVEYVALGIMSLANDYNGVLNFAFMQLEDLKDPLNLSAIITYTPTGTSYGLDLAPPVVNNASTVYPGRIRDYIPALAALSGWAYNVTYTSSHVSAVSAAQNPATTSPQHTLISLMWPLMDYFWSNGKTSNLIALLSGILDSSTISTVSGVQVAGGSTTAHVLQALEGVNGTGTLTMALRSHGTNDQGLLDNALPLLCKIINQLDSAGVLRTNANNLTDELDTALEDWVDASSHPGQDPDTLFIQKLDQTLFSDTDSQGRTTIDRTRLFLEQNHTPLSDLCTDLGDLITQNNSLDPLVAYTSSSNCFVNLQTIWDSGNTWDKLSADIDAISANVQTITGNADFDFMLSLETLMADLEDLDNDPVDIGNKPMTALIRHLLRQGDIAGSYNPFVDNLLSIVCEALDLYDENYNPSALVSPTGISENTTVVRAFESLTGYYDLEPAMHLLSALTEKQTDAGDLLLYKLLGDLSTLGDAVLGTDELPVSILQCLFRDVPVKGTPTSAAAVVIDQIDLSGVVNGSVSMQGVIHDLYTLFNGLDITPGGDVYTTIYQALDFAVQNTVVRP